ncbi:MAG: cytochrome b N-terminal domain-containing protein [Desulfobacterales bacterium]|nr:cytochrome b N-terminal domain-containing protein [Desulfobacterales bacterium]
MAKPPQEFKHKIFRTGLPRTPEQRLQVARRSVFLHLHPSRIAADRMKIGFTWCLGGLSFMLFLVTVVTGALLMIYYRPVLENAYADMLDLSYAVFLGRFTRNVHRWAGHGIVITVVVHMLRVFYTGSYKPPREFNWIVGVCLLLIVLAFAFTGYLLPWDQISYWGTRVGTHLLHSVPLLGADGPFGSALGLKPDGDLAVFVLGDADLGPRALVRFYSLHVFILPVFAVVFLMVHFWRVRKDGNLAAKL